MPTNKQTTSSGSQSKSKTSSTKQSSSMNFEFAKDKNLLDDSAVITDILVMQKGLIKRYGNALCEGSCEKFRGLINKNLSEAANDQFDSFLYMKQKKLYPVETAPSPKLTEAKDKFKSKEKNMKC